MLRYILYIILSKRRSAKYRLPIEIYSPLRRIWTLKADGLTTHRERSLSVHCLHSSVLFSSFFGTEVFSFLTSRIISYHHIIHIVWIRERKICHPDKFLMSVFNRFFHSFSCFVFLFLWILVNRLTLTGKPVYLCRKVSDCPFYGTECMLYYNWHIRKAFLLCFPYFLILKWQSAVLYSGLSLFLI